jgi:KUP system potassium uptake protein
MAAASRPTASWNAPTRRPFRVAGTAIFITPRLDEVPGSLLHNLKHNKVLHERVIFLRVDVQDVPFVPPEKRITVNKLGKGFLHGRSALRFFPDARCAVALEGARPYGLSIDLDTTTFFIRRETLVPARVSAMPKWQTTLFIKLMVRRSKRPVLSPAARPCRGVGITDEI